MGPNLRDGHNYGNDALRTLVLSRIAYPTPSFDPHFRLKVRNKG